MSHEDTVRAFHAAYQAQDRAALEALMAPDFSFSSPRDDRWRCSPCATGG